MRIRTTVSVVAVLLISATCIGCESSHVARDLLAPGLGEAPSDSLDSQACSGAPTDGCVRPVVLTGRIVDVASGAGIVGALVFAGDATGAVVTNAAVTDATGAYSLTVPVPRDGQGNPMPGTFRLRASASGYRGFPTASRPMPPVSTADARLVADARRYEVTNAHTNLSLVALPPEARGLASISGTAFGDAPGGALVVAECANAPCPFGYADRSGQYTIFNVPDGSYTVRAYKKSQQLAPARVRVSSATDLIAVDLYPSAGPLVMVSAAMLNPVVSPELLPASAVLMRAATFRAVPFAPIQTEPEVVAVGSNPTFDLDDGAEGSAHEIVVTDALGNRTWTSSIARGASSIVYAGPALAEGMYYNWRVISSSAQDAPMDATEDLHGVFVVTEP